MLKSTYKPSAAKVAAATAALPPGWTEHAAPTGHTYYYNENTKESTYKRPGTVPLPQHEPSPSAFSPYSAIPNLADPNVANAYVAQFNQPPPSQSHYRGGGHGSRGGRGGHDGRPRPQPVDKPRRKELIPGCEPWVLVYTKCSRRFVYNPEKNTSYWRIPEKLMPAILELDKKRILNRAGDETGAEEQPKGSTEDGVQGPAPRPAAQPQAAVVAPAAEEYDSSEYEEVEVTDDEADGDADPDSEQPSKRRRTGESPGDEEGIVEFTEADIAMQLQAMGEDYGLEPGDYDDGNMEDWPEGTEGLEISIDDAKFLFKDLLNDFRINPYSPWDKLMEEGKIIDDPRYTALTTTKARRDCWDEWTREKITESKEKRKKQEKKDPRVAYMAFLQEKGTPKLYWPEFKRKYKKEAPMKDLSILDKDREKAYREHINRLKMPQATLRSDFTALLKAQPLHLLHSQSISMGLPIQVLVDARYISLDPKERDALIEAYVQTLPPPPEDLELAAEDEDEKRKTRESREKREKALEERNRAVEEQRRNREREVAVSKARLREEERELEVAMRIGKRGLQSQFAEGRREDKSEDKLEDKPEDKPEDKQDEAS